MELSWRNRNLSRLKQIASKVWKFEPKLPSTNEELANMSDALRARAAKGEPLDSLLPEAYALVREVADRTLKKRPYDEQIWGAIALHEGKVIEMANGEGKTLVATMPAYLNSLSGQSIHIATYNDFLARRDAQWMGPIYLTLGLSVGVIQSGNTYRLCQQDGRYFLFPCSRKDAYACNITYGTHQVFVFDYLCDNMVADKEQIVQRSLDYIILDEADSVLIDRARMPLQLNYDQNQQPQWYRQLLEVARQLEGTVDFIWYPQWELTSAGIMKVEKILGAESLYSIEQAGVAHQLIQSLQAIHSSKVDRDYIVKDGRIVLVDEYTGRLMPSSMYPGGLHQAIEAKEGMKISPDRRKSAEISFQHFFKLYSKVAGMTGTAQTVEEELRDKYQLDVVVIPTHRPMIRKDYPDAVYKTVEGKFHAVVREIEECYQAGRPVLVGTVSIEASEMLCERLERRGIQAQVLNAKHDEEEAAIIAQAGWSGMVTIATNMAGRGVDILLGGNAEVLAREKLSAQGVDPASITPEQFPVAWTEAEKICAADREKVVALGGLHVIGTERHEARRIDNQLRGRAGRQGDPGSSRFYVSPEDDLMRRFGGDQVKRVMDWAQMDEDEPLEHNLLSKTIERSQRRMEGYNADLRERLFEYDSVLDKQRKFIYSIRRKAVMCQDISQEINTIIDNVVMRAMERFMADRRRPEQWNTKGLADLFCGLSSSFKNSSFAGLGNHEWGDIKEWLLSTLNAAREGKKGELGEETMTVAERVTLMRRIDLGWANHLHRLDTLQEERALRSHVEEDPSEWFTMRSNQVFWDTIEQIEIGFLHDLFIVQLAKRE